MYSQSLPIAIILLTILPFISSFHNTENHYNSLQPTIDETTLLEQQYDETFTSFVELSLDPSQYPITPPLNTTRKIDGKIKLNGIQYRTICQCEENDAAAAKAISECFAPTRLRIRQEPFNRKLGLSKQQLVTVIGTPQEKVNDIIDVTVKSFHDIEGVETKPQLSTPGGDFGEFLIGLAEYELLTNKQLTIPEIDKLMTGWVTSQFRNQVKMYMMTNLQSFERLKTRLKVRGSAGMVVDLNLQSPPNDYKEQLRIDLRDPRNHGSAFIRSVLSKPQRFNMRDGLVGDAVQVFFDILWNKDTQIQGCSNATYNATAAQPKNDDRSYSCKLSDHITFEILDPQPAQEKAWLNIRSNFHCEAEHRAPLFLSRTDTTSVFINHPQAVLYWRHQLSQYFTLHAQTAGFPITVNHFYKRLKRRGLRNTEMCAEMIGRDVPYYTVTVE